MSLESDAAIQVLLRERVRVTASAAVIVRDVHAADDIYQQVVLAALEHRAEFREEEHVVAWAVRAARHRAIDLARRKQLKLVPSDVLDLLAAEWSDLQGYGSIAHVDALHRCLSKIGEPAKNLLRMRYCDGLAVSTIAGQLSRTSDAIYQSLSRLQRALRACIEADLNKSELTPQGEGVR